MRLFHQRALGALPRASDPFEPLEGPTAKDPEEAEGNGAGEHLLYEKQLVRFPEQKAEPCLSGFDFRNKNQDQRHAGAEPEARKNIWQGSWNDDFHKNLTLVCAEIARRLKQHRIDRLDSGNRIDENQKNYSNHDRHDLG